MTACAGPEHEAGSEAEPKDGGGKKENKKKKGKNQNFSSDVTPVTPPRSHRTHAGARRTHGSAPVLPSSADAVARNQNTEMYLKQAQGTCRTNPPRAMAHQEKPSISGHSSTDTSRCRTVSRQSPCDDGESTGGLCHLASTFRHGLLRWVFSPTR